MSQFSQLWKAFAIWERRKPRHWYVIAVRMSLEDLGYRVLPLLPTVLEKESLPPNDGKAHLMISALPTSQSTEGSVSCT